jgi:uncharacterized protein YciI
MTADEQSALAAHAQFLATACETGRCVVAGPALDAGLGIAIWDRIELADLVLLLENEDQMIKHGFFDAQVRAMRVSFERPR